MSKSSKTNKPKAAKPAKVSRAKLAQQQAAIDAMIVADDGSVTSTAPAVEAATTQIPDVAQLVAAPVTGCPCCGADHSLQTTESAEVLVCGNCKRRWSLRTRREVNKYNKQTRSSIERPTKKVWAIADTMPNASRKEVVAACLAQGIAYFTARTQYQLWYAMTHAPKVPAQVLVVTSAEAAQH